MANGNRLANESSPYLRQHADNPVDWFAWGSDAFDAARGAGRADPVERGLLVVPLVPRDGARVVRRRSYRDRDEPTVREREGRPRGATRRRRHLHGCHAGDDRTRRLADDRVPHARWAPVLRRHVLPEVATPGLAVVHADPRDRARRVDESTRRHRPASRSVDRRDLADRRSSPDDATLPGADALPAAGPALRRQYDAAWGGFGGAPKFPQTMAHEALLRLHARHRRRRRAADRRQLARRDGERRHLRPPRRWLLALLGRRAVDRAALREDALRQRAAGPRLPARVADHRQAPLPSGARRDDRVPAPRPAPPRRRLLLRRGRRQRGRGGQVLRVLARRGGHLAARRGLRRRRRRRGGRVVRRHRGRQLRRAQHPRSVRCGAICCVRRSVERGAGRAARATATGACAPASTTRCSPSGTR